MATSLIADTLVFAGQPDASVLSAGLTRAGCRALVVPTPIGVAEAIEQSAFSAIVIAEASLPEDTSAFLRSLRRDTDAVIVVVGWGGAEHRVRRLMEGADSYLTRPIPDDYLRARLHALTTRRRTRVGRERDFLFLIPGPVAKN